MAGVSVVAPIQATWQRGDAVPVQRQGCCISIQMCLTFFGCSHSGAGVLHPAGEPVIPPRIIHSAAVSRSTILRNRSLSG